jgi:hypothetical protein
MRGQASTRGWLAGFVFGCGLALVISSAIAFANAVPQFGVLSLLVGVVLCVASVGPRTSARSLDRRRGTG